MDRDTSVADRVRRVDPRWRTADLAARLQVGLRTVARERRNLLDEAPGSFVDDATLERALIRKVGLSVAQSIIGHLDRGPEAVLTTADARRRASEAMRACVTEDLFQPIGQSPEDTIMRWTAHVMNVGFDTQGVEPPTP